MKCILSFHKCTLEQCKRSIRKVSNIILVGRKEVYLYEYILKKIQADTWSLLPVNNFSKNSSNTVLTSGIFISIYYWSALFLLSFMPILNNFCRSRVS